MNKNTTIIPAAIQRSDWETDEYLFGIDVLLSEKPKDKSISKAVEELSELTTKLMQYINKPQSIIVGDIEEEIADVEMHLRVLKTYYPVAPQIREKKINKFLNSDEYKMYLKTFENKNTTQQSNTTNANCKINRNVHDCSVSLYTSGGCNGCAYFNVTKNK